MIKISHTKAIAVLELDSRQLGVEIEDPMGSNVPVDPRDEHVLYRGSF